MSSGRFSFLIRNVRNAGFAEWLLCGYCVVTVWLLCGYCVATVWLLCGYCAGAVRVLCGCCAGAVRALCGRCVGAVWNLGWPHFVVSTGSLPPCTSFGSMLVVCVPGVTAHVPPCSSMSWTGHSIEVVSTQPTLNSGKARRAGAWAELRAERWIPIERNRSQSDQTGT